MFGNGEPTTVKAMVTGVSTVSVWGINLNIEEVSFWFTILADFGVFAGGLTTVVLGIKSLKESRDKK
tara:strand:+ start:1166 stop:1366 length:201 start_codon:yes stop_codon:yes gene_type:complete